MAKDPYQELESPFLDEEVLAVPEASEESSALDETFVAESEAESEPEADFVEREDKGTANTVSVILDQPSESDDKFQLVSTDGKFSKTLAAAQAKALVTGEKVLTFPEVNPSKKYRLIHIRSAGSKRVVLPDIPFQFLTAAGHGPRTAMHTYVTLPSQVPSKLPDRYGIERDVDPILVAPSPQLVDLNVEDPKF